MTGERCVFDVRLLDTRGCETRLSESGGFFIWCVYWRVVVASNAVNGCSFCVVVLGAVLRVYEGIPGPLRSMRTIVRGRILR